AWARKVGQCRLGDCRRAYCHATGKCLSHIAGPSTDACMVRLTRFVRLIEPGALQFSPKITEKALKLFRCNSGNRWGSPMSHDATNILSLDRHRGPGTYAEALLVQSHEKEAAVLNFGWSTRENVICSKTTQGILESVINPNTMEVIHYWPNHRETVRRLVKVE